MAQGASRLVGRDAELGRLAHAVAVAREGVRTVIVLEGDAGFGKSRLVAEAMRRVREPTDRLGAGYGVELAGPEIPYRVATDLLRTLSRDAGVDVVREAAGAYAAALVPLNPGLADPDDSRDLEASPARVLPAFAATVEQLATDQLVWLVVEDLPWVDASSRDLLTYLIRTVQQAQLLVLVTVRSHDPVTDPAVSEAVAEWGRLDGVARLTVSPLEPGAVRELVSELSPGATGTFVDQVVREAQGSPLLAEQLVAAGPEAPEGVAAVENPMLSRLRRLEPDPLRLVQMASLGDGHLGHRLLQAAYGAPEEIFDAAVDRALQVGLLAYRPEEREFRFTHPLLRAAAEATVTPGDRHRSHRRWGRVLSSPQHRHDPGLLIAAARHWAATDDDDETFTASLAAARETLRLGAASQTADLLLRAWNLWDRVPRAEALADRSRDDLLLDLADAMQSADRLTEIIPVLEEEINVSQQAPDEDALRTLCVRLAVEDYRGVLGWPEDEPLFREALARVEELLAAPASRLLMPTLNCLGWQQRFSDAGLADRLFDRELEVAHAACGPSEITFAATQVAHQRTWRGSHEEALRACDAALGHCRSVVDYLYVESTRAHALAWSGQLDAAVSQMDQTLARLPDPTLAPSEWVFAALIAIDWRMAVGNWSGAEALLVQCERLEVEEWALGISILTKASTFAVCRGDIDTATRLAAEARTRLGPEGKVWDMMRGAVRTADALVTAARGDHAKALQLLDPELRFPGKDCAATHWPYVALAAEVAADWVALGGGPPSEKLALLGDTLEQLPRAGPHLQAWYLHAKCDVARARGSDTANQWAEVREAWRDLDHVPQVGWASYRLAETRVRHGEKSSAQASLSEAWQIADRLGAGPLRDAVVTLSRRTRIPIDSGASLDSREGRVGGRLAVLTERELEVLRHVASGLSNHEIAQTLFISPKTASVHVSHILTKLDVSTRTQATAVALQAGLDIHPI